MSVHASLRDGLDSPWIVVMKRAYVNFAISMVERGACVSIMSGQRSSPLRVALQNGWIDLAKSLIGHGASISAAAGEDGNVLYIARSRGYEDLVKLLEGQGAVPVDDAWRMNTRKWLDATKGNGFY